MTWFALISIRAVRQGSDAGADLGTTPATMHLGLILFLAAVVAVGLWMVFTRLRLLEERIGEMPLPEEMRGELEPLRGGQDQLKGAVEEMGRSLEAVRSAPASATQADVAALREEFRQFASRVESLAGDLEDLGSRVASVAPADPTPRDKVIRHLVEDGYESVRLVGEQEAGGPPLRLAVEARRRGVEYKGHATLGKDGSVEANLTPSYKLFP